MKQHRLVYLNAGASILNVLFCALDIARGLWIAACVLFVAAAFSAGMALWVSGVVPRLLAKRRRVKTAAPAAPAAPVTEAIVGYRGWSITTEGLLASANGVLWPERVAFVASARGCSCGDVAPQFSCTCGVYAFKTFGDLMAEHSYSQMDVLGSVSLWGKVISHEIGYRARRAYPRTLYYEKHNEMQVKALANAYAIETSPMPAGYAKMRAGVVAANQLRVQQPAQLANQHGMWLQGQQNLGMQNQAHLYGAISAGSIHSSPLHHSLQMQNGMTPADFQRLLGGP